MVEKILDDTGKPVQGPFDALLICLCRFDGRSFKGPVLQDDAVRRLGAFVATDEVAIGGDSGALLGSELFGALADVGWYGQITLAEDPPWPPA